MVILYGQIFEIKELEKKLCTLPIISITFDSMPCGSPGYFGTAFDNLIKRKSMLDSLTCVYTNLPGLFLQNCFPLYEIVTSTIPGCDRAGV